MSKTNKPFSFFPVFDKEANNKVVSQIMKTNKSPMELLIWATKYSKKDEQISNTRNRGN